LIPFSSMTMAGNALWVGGTRFIAQVNPAQNQVRHYAYVQASSVNRLQVAGGYVWAQLGCRL